MSRVSGREEAKIGGATGREVLPVAPLRTGSYGAVRPTGIGCNLQFDNRERRESEYAFNLPVDLFVRVVTDLDGASGASSGAAAASLADGADDMA